MPVDKLGFNINDWVVDTIETIKRMEDQIAALERRVTNLERIADVHISSFQILTGIVSFQADEMMNLKLQIQEVADEKHSALGPR